MSKILRNSFCSILFYVGFIWLHTFIRLSSYTYNSGMSGYILKASITVVATAFYYCLLYTSDAADELDGVDLGGRRIIKKKKKNFFQAEDGIRDQPRSRGLGDVYKRQAIPITVV